ncbi:TonB-dependent receptor [Stutzerimonas kirkiae]|uniref:TonB-dependent receptor n=2 Tax=Stutzerimonas kirkiae TaxID=2211392 RepID=A0A4Q9QYX7_9GAMM|nr:TonB-dependent receptor [Stutzerimonas kirkiae]TBU99581.1 TonB-dependent receptor [Stutzerimonas kirkiae]
MGETRFMAFRTMLKRGALAATIAGATLATTPQALLADSRVQHYDIAAGPLDRVLLDISRQSGQTISFAPEASRYSAAPIHGELSTEQAVQHALQGTGLELQVSPGGAFVIVHSGATPTAKPKPKTTGAEVSPAQAPRLGQVVVLGTRRSDVTDLSSPTPVDVVSAERLQSTGFSDLQQALQATVPSINYPRNRANGAVAANRTLSLRGLSPDQTLILINGKRHHVSPVVDTSDGVARSSQAVDISSIPVSAVERVEVLRDGASAQYGSDAIAGVINVVLKERDSGGRAEAQYGELDQGDGLTRNLSAWKGFSLPGDGFLTLSAEGNKTGYTMLAEGYDNRQWYFDGETAKEEAANGMRDKTKFGLGRSENYSLLGNGEIGLGGGFTGYATANYRHRIAHNTGPFRLPKDDATVRSIFPDGYSVWIWSRTDDAFLTLGSRYQDQTLGNFDLNLTHGWGRVRMGSYNNLNPSYGDDSPTRFYAGRMTTEQTTLALDWNRDLELAFSANPLTLSAGAAHRRETYELGAGDRESWANGGVPILDGPNAGNVAPVGSQAWAGFSDEVEKYGAKRENWSAYLGLEGEVLDKLQVGLTGRAENYSDFGNSTTGKLSLRYDFTPRIAVRGAYSTGFRAPTVGQQGYYSEVSGRIGQQTPLTLHLPAYTALAQTLGAQELKAEKSQNLSAGIVLRPWGNASLTLDAYRIKVRDRIVLSEILADAQTRATLDSLGLQSIYGVTYFTNGVDTTTHGFDLVGSQHFDLKGYGNLDLTLAYNRNRTSIDSIDQFDSGGAVIGRQVRGLITEGSPKDTLVLSARYAYGDWDFWLSATRYGRYGGYNNQDPSQDQYFDPDWVTDLSVTRRFKSFDVTLGGLNIFDQKPDLNASKMGVDGTGRQTYSSLAAYNPAGAYYYLKVGLDF